MPNSSVEQNRKIYNIAHWSAGYFDINADGNLIAYPQGKSAKHTIVFPDLIKHIQQRGLHTPVLVRFTDILKHRVDTLRDCFTTAIQSHDYQGQYMPVYPIKVNQQRHVVEELKYRGQVGLEAGSKPELLAVLSMQSAKPKDKTNNDIIICNGYKDCEYIRLALIGQQLGFKVFIIIEKPSEVELIFEQAKALNITPQLGMRVRLASLGKGKWQNTGGEKAKFGLQAEQVLHIVEQLKAAKQLACLSLLHIHMGSQIANIRDIQRGLQELSYYYAALHELGATIDYVDLGGGLGVDYEGTNTRSIFSMNYSVQEYAQHVIAAFSAICKEKSLKHPTIITETGRALTAHHAVLITDINGIEYSQLDKSLPAVTDNDAKILSDLQKIYQELDNKPVLECYHEVIHLLEDVHSLFSCGQLSLTERAKAEKFYRLICHKIKHTLDLRNHAHREVLDQLNEKLADKVFTNFSLFQSLPDIWAIQQIFPILPLSHLQQEPTQRVTIQDLTCDSDGRIDRYVDGQGVHTSLPLPEYQPDKPYYLGFFMAGAYQETLGDIHNLFGRVNSVHVRLTEQGKMNIEHAIVGDSVTDVLKAVNFDAKAMLENYRQQLQASALPESVAKNYLAELVEGLTGYTYLE